MEKTQYNKLLICFLLYSIFGWIYEVFLEVVVYKWGFTNRGVLFGPYCPVYGFGAIIFILLFYKFKKESKMNILLKMIIIFTGCMISATLIELATSYILEAITGAWPWQTYVDYKINFQGRIALSPSIRFGLGGLLFLYIFQPFFDKILYKINKNKIKIVNIIILLIFGIDFLYTIFIR